MFNLSMLRVLSSASGAKPGKQVLISKNESKEDMFKVLISDAMSSKAEEICGASDKIQVDVKAGISPEDLKACIGEYNGLLVRSRTKVTDEVIAKADNLKVIGRAGIGVDNIDLKSASEKGIFVENAPTGNAITTAEHAISLMMSLARHIPQATASLKSDKWEKKKYQGSEIFEKNLGIIGLGNIGKIVADRAQGLKMNVFAFDPVVSEADAKALGITLVSFDELLKTCDFFSIHAPFNDKTKGMLNDAAFAKMKKGACIINAARGGIVDEKACLTALNNDTLAGAAFDVFEKEPPDEGHPLIKHPRVICTPHLGASTKEAQIKVAVIVAEQMVDYAERGETRNVVNKNML